MVQQIEDGYNEAGPDGLTLTEKRDILGKLSHEFVDDQYDAGMPACVQPLRKTGSGFSVFTNLTPMPCVSSTNTAKKNWIRFLRR